MKTGRLSYDQEQLAEIPEEEPVFVIRGQDAVGAAAVRGYANLAAEAGAAPALVDACYAHAERMERWPIKKLPDLPGEEERPATPLEALKYARRFVDEKVCDVAYLDAAIAAATET